MHFITGYDVDDAEGICDTIKWYGEIWKESLDNQHHPDQQLTPMAALSVGFLKRIKIYDETFWDRLIHQISDDYKILSPSAIDAITHILMRSNFWTNFSQDYEIEPL